MTKELAKEMISKLQTWIDSNEEPLNIQFPSWWLNIQSNSGPKTREQCVEGCKWLIGFLNRNYIEIGE
jgi:hypothetical protein